MRSPSFAALLLALASRVTATSPGPPTPIWLRTCNWYANTTYISSDVNYDTHGTPAGKVPESRVLLLNECYTQKLEPGLAFGSFIGLRNNTESAEVGSKRTHDTKIEVTVEMDGTPPYFDVDVEKGWSAPVVFKATSPDGNVTTRAGCTVDKLLQCPEHMQVWENNNTTLANCVGKGQEAIDFFRADCPDLFVLSSDTRAVTSAPVGTKILELDIGVPPWEVDDVGCEEALQ
ncbi:hypothetical protein B0A50_06568 [Salinomyces thailandicus]|uniref:Uncharacterized protein n=1 Tax=Salinomyces thailandicus TaxID=706561 RepID=A0A4V5N3S7_9PEZI|nr:hypothetical protein B0A50_06568 [Salinomyces thailandica]